MVRPTKDVTVKKTRAKSRREATEGRVADGSRKPKVKGEGRGEVVRPIRKTIRLPGRNRLEHHDDLILSALHGINRSRRAKAKGRGSWFRNWFAKKASTQQALKIDEDALEAINAMTVDLVGRIVLKGKEALARKNQTAVLTIEDTIRALTDVLGEGKLTNTLVSAGIVAAGGIPSAFQPSNAALPTHTQEMATVYRTDKDTLRSYATHPNPVGASLDLLPHSLRSESIPTPPRHRARTPHSTDESDEEFSSPQCSSENLSTLTNSLPARASPLLNRRQYSAGNIP